MDERELIREAMRALGSRKSARKAKTSAQNIQKARSKRWPKKKLKKSLNISNG